MPLQEAIIFGPRVPLARPAGVGFGPPCKSRDADATIWTNTISKLRTALGQGNAVGLIVQTRNGRQWDAQSRNPAFSYKEDYLIAAYTLAPALGAPWLPGRMLKDWINLFALGRHGMAKYEPVAGMDQVFQCSAAGCGLSKSGVVKMVKFHEKSGKSREEAIDTQMLEMLRPPDKKTQGRTRYSAGWTGGNFGSGRPSMLRGPMIGMRPPNYQAPLPPPRR